MSESVMNESKYLVKARELRACLTIHYNCVGVIDIPAALPIPAPEVTMNTRKGVYVSYAAAPAAS